ncbi:MAG: MarR family transcriptional regulator [Candidatus Cloacimonetes bacterium]|nr:MarR family transcriptional regulator [Candidatus Cloacimonadota bacterium]
MKNLVKEFAELSNQLYSLCSQKELTRRKCLSLGKMECDLLFHLSEIDKPVCMNDLAAELEVSHSRITRIIDNLVHKNLVHRFPSQKDRRSWLAELTKEGKTANSKSVNEFMGIQTDIIKSLPQDKLEDILESIKLYIAAYKTALTKREENS